MRVLVTGAAGYLGTTMVPMMLDKGWRVTVLDRFSKGRPFYAGQCFNPLLDIVQGDITDAETFILPLSRANVVVNLAARVGISVCEANQAEAYRTNYEAARFIAGSMGTDQLLIQPTAESGYGIGYSADVCTEEDALNPTSLYARTKVDAEKHVIDAGGVSLRLASVFGMSPRMRIDLMVNEFVWRAVQDRSVVLFEGHFRRNFVHVRDVAGAVIHAIENERSMRGGIFNCGRSDDMMTKRDLCARIAQFVPGFKWFESPTVSDPDRRDFIVSNRKLEATGWVSRHSVSAGIEELIKGYRMISKGEFYNG